MPPGFVVLIAAFQQQIEDRPEVSAAISHLEKVARGLISEDLKTVSEKTTELISRTEITEQVKKPLLLELNKFDEHQSWRWAVRSSASGEDSEDASYAGQNSTFLGCATAEEVLEAVAKCWASVYSYSSVEYRRQNGSDVRNDIAVVVQKMVDADCAGVLFTCEPLEGNPDCLVISSNYGLGEVRRAVDEADFNGRILERSFGLIGSGLYRLKTRHERQHHFVHDANRK